VNVKIFQVLPGRVRETTLDAVFGEAFDLVGAPLVDLPGRGVARGGKGVLGVGQSEGELRAVLDQFTHRGRLWDRHPPTV
jgi:hypothetical protein